MQTVVVENTDKVGKSYTPEDDSIFWNYGLSQLEEDLKEQRVVSCKVVKCHSDMSLSVLIGKYRATIESADVCYREKDRRKVKIQRLVGKSVKAVVKEVSIDESGKAEIKLSRAEAQRKCLEEFILKLPKGYILKATVDGASDFGIFCDIGCGLSELVPSGQLSISKLDLFKVAQDNRHLNVIIRDNSNPERIELSHKELLGTFEELTNDIKVGDTVMGTVINKSDFGFFVALGANIKGLADPSPKFNGLKPFDWVIVTVKSINVERMKIRLGIVDVIPKDEGHKLRMNYKITSGIMKHWKYSPDGCEREIETVF